MCVHLRVLIAKMSTLDHSTCRLDQDVRALRMARAKTVRWAVPLKVHSVAASRLENLTQGSESGRENGTWQDLETQLACEYECSISAVANPSYARVHEWPLPPHLFAWAVLYELGQRGKTHVTSPQNAAKIGWRCAGGVGPALVGGHGCRGYSSECFESAGAKEMTQEVMVSRDDARDPILVAGNPNYAHACNSHLLPRQLGYGPTRWVTMVVNVLANGMHYLELILAGPSQDGVRGSWSPSATWFESGSRAACSTLAHVHVGVPFRYLSCALGLHSSQIE